jgi:putative transcriptional regulator
MRVFLIYRRWFLAAAATAVTVVFALTFVPAGLSSAGSRTGSEVAETYGDALLEKGKFLVARSTILDPSFRETVVLLVGYDAAGATGLIINRPTKLLLASILPNVPALEKRSDVVYYGGPVEGQRMFMLIRSDQKLEEADRVLSDVYVSASRNTLERMLDENKTQKQLKVYSGYAGWLPGQLSREVLRGDWYIVDADTDTIFEKKESEIWRELTDRSSSIEVWKHTDKGSAPDALNEKQKELLVSKQQKTEISTPSF